MRVEGKSFGMVESLVCAGSMRVVLSIRVSDDVPGVPTPYIWDGTGWDNNYLSEHHARAIRRD